MKRHIKTLILGTLVGMGSTTMNSCSDLLDLTPEDYFSAYSFWQSQTEYEGFVSALSNQFRANYPSNILFYAGELRAGTLELNTIDGSGALNVEYIQNIYNEATNYQFSNFGGYYGFIANLNELIYRCENDGGVLTADVKNGLLAMAYGWRAFSYFQMYRMYGGLVLRLTPDVVLGQYDPTQLYKGRSSAEETLTQIKKDVQTSLDYYAQTDYAYNNGTSADYYWSKAATEMLAGEVYLWSGKVATDDHAANPADVEVAADYFDNVINDYGYELQDDYFSVWTTPHNAESIYSICYTDENDASYYNYPPYYFLWARTTGTSYQNYWSTMDEEGWGHVEGVANRFGRWYDPLTGNESDIDIWSISSFGPMHYTYKNSLFFQFDEADLRRTMFYPQYRVKEDETDVRYLPDFDPTQYDLAGTFVCKFRPKIISSSTYYTFANDMPIYRLALAYLYAAECANYAGNNEQVEYYINAIRERAYGSNWNQDLYGYEAGSFAENEAAILREKDKEFVMEGQRWWDLRRLTKVKGGSQQDHLVFQPEGCVGYGLDPVANPWMIDISGNPIETDVPVLNGTTQDEHLLLWPIDASVIASDPELQDQQNPGY